ncbi:glycosyltransferase family 2 protein [Porphyromonas somerae]|uniref:glycosyltransferase family 2 protein n=1 Tax=Porphyromonas somerae TaxID=322095 RepID=UPI001FCAA421|nr:glycosyltransferase family 2 protein [Porphyromonas somerae]BDE82929.1 hypothetical protein CE91St14_19570 [Porphyromonas somerae]
MVSIIVPIYNAQSYLKECLQSIKDQTFKDFEVICINDGSRDASLIICEDFTKLDSRFKVYSQENKGVSIARNNGIKHSKGEFIVFIDSDDIIDKNYLMTLVGLSNQNIDLCIGHYCRELTSLGTIKGSRHATIFNPQTYIDSLLKKKIQFSTICCMLFKRSIIIDNNILFKPELYWGEDSLFYFTYIANIKGNIALSFKALYYYRHNDSSAMNTVVAYKALSAVDASQETEDVLISSGLLRQEDALIKAGTILKLIFIASKANSKELYEALYDKYDVHSYMKKLAKQSKVTKIRLASIYYILCGKKLFYKTLMIINKLTR